jgi:transcription factor E
MKRDEKLFSFSKAVAKRIAGKPGEDVIELLFDKDNFNEFKIAEKLKKNINEIRNILYKLSSFNVISSTRKKDKRKGWYTYFWTFNPAKALEVLLKFKEQEYFNLDHILKSRITKNFYYCESDGIEMSEETALNHNFSCPECSQLLTPVNEEKKVKEITQKVELAKKEIDDIRKKLNEIAPKPVLPEKKEKKKAKKVKKKPKNIKSKKKAKKKAKQKKSKPKKKAKQKKSKPKKKAKKAKKKRL